MTKLVEPSQVREIALELATPAGTLAHRSSVDVVKAPGVMPPARADTARTSRFGGYGLFIAMVVAPCMLAALYLFVIASDRFESEVKFVVRTVGDPGAMDSANLSVGLHGVSRTHDDAYVVNDYVVSRDALSWLIEHENLRDVFARPQADFLNRYPNPYTSDNLEGFYRYFKRMVTSEIDDTTGISTIKVVAFSADDAQRIARGLVHSSEGLVNRLNQRSEADAVAVADNDLARAKSKVAEIEAKLNQYRTSAGFVDAQSENRAALKTVTDLTTELARLEATLNQQRLLMPDSPSIRSQQSRVSALRDEIARLSATIAGATVSIASKAGEYERLVAELSIAQKGWESAEAYKASARRAAEKKHLYLQVVVEANAPDQYSFPRKKLDFFLTLVVAEMIFMIVRHLRQFAYEHAL